MFDQLLIEICTALTIKLCDQPNEQFTRLCREERPNELLLEKTEEKESKDRRFVRDSEANITERFV